MIKLYITVLKRFDRYLPGAKLRINADDDGTPLDRFWRRRIADADLDNSLTVSETEIAGFVNGDRSPETRAKPLIPKDKRKKYIPPVKKIPKKKRRHAI